MSLFILIDNLLNIRYIYMQINMKEIEFEEKYSLYFFLYNGMNASNVSQHVKTH
jgi:hypothetical protein